MKKSCKKISGNYVKNRNISRKKKFKKQMQNVCESNCENSSRKTKFRKYKNIEQGINPSD